MTGRNLPGYVLTDDDDLADSTERWPVVATRRPYDGGFVSVREDTVRSGSGESFVRTVLEHRGAVGVVALDETDRVLLLLQYRHPVGERLVEIPAGILDVDGEDPVDAAARELAEEASLVASDWRLLLELAASPGISDERWTIYLARGLTPAGEQPERRFEEADMTQVWVPLDTAVDAVLSGRMSDSMACAGVLAASVAVSRGAVESLRRPVSDDD